VRNVLSGGVGVGVGVAVGVALGLAVGVALGLTVGVALGLTVGVALGLAVGVALGVALAVGRGYGVGRRCGVGRGLGVGAEDCCPAFKRPTLSAKATTAETISICERSLAVRLMTKSVIFPMRVLVPNWIFAHTRQWPFTFLDGHSFTMALSVSQIS
jgi:hypothetical protein